VALAREDTAEMPHGSRKRRRRRIPRGRFLLRWLAVGVVLFIAFLYSQPLRSYLSTRDALAERTGEVKELRAKKLRLERRLAEGDTPAALEREARRLGYVKPGERLFIVKGIASWRRTHERDAAR
jgi:cell division protein FtsB